jgi:hypothetical protein
LRLRELVPHEEEEGRDRTASASPRPGCRGTWCRIVATPLSAFEQRRVLLTLTLLASAGDRHRQTILALTTLELEKDAIDDMEFSVRTRAESDHDHEKQNRPVISSKKTERLAVKREEGDGEGGGGR